MSKTNNSSKAERIEKKKQQILAARKKQDTVVISSIVFIGVLILLGIFFLDFGGNKKADSRPPATTVGASQSVSQQAGDDNPAADSTAVAYAPRLDKAANRISFPVAAFDDGEAKYYEYPTDDGINIRYFVLKSSDGIVRAAFDACDVCWRAGLGYVQSGDKMVCRNCGRQFASARINEVQGGCNPAPLKREIVGDNLIIDIDDIIAGRQYFDLGGRG
jgi:uncharacterized membrane protein